MATRRQRPSLDAVITSNNAMKNPTLEAFEDFRRRHSRQNKDIVIDNALRRTTVKTLQDEIAKLHVELLQLRQANVLLTTKVRRLQAESATRDAIDQILGAVPALRQFRDALQSSPSSLPSADPNGKSKPWTLETTENPTATRPAAFGADLMRRDNLAPLVEASEYGSEDGEALGPTIDERRIKRMPKGRRRTEIGSVALRSPRPNGRPTPSDLFVVDTPPHVSVLFPIPLSPASSRGQSPSPRKLASPEKRAKKRRPSGTLIQLQTRKLSPKRHEGVGDVEDIPDWEEGRNIVILPVKPAPRSQAAAKAGAVARCDMSEVGGALGANANVGTSTARIVENTIGLAERPNGVDSVKGKAKALAPTVTVEEEISVAASRPSRASSIDSIAFTESDSVISAIDDDIGRGRRARRSVNYKEPSLMKKMRKPDGVSVEETLRLPRQSISSASLLPPDTPGNASISSTGSKSVNSKRALQHLSGPRRKSVLPKPGGRLARMSSPEEDEDEVEDDLDVQLGLRDPAPLTSGDEAGGDAYVPSSPATPADVSPMSVPIHAKKSVTSIPRIAPRKTVKKPDGLGVGGVQSTPALARVPSNGSRAALVTRPDANGRPITNTPLSVVGKGVPMQRKAISTVRKASA